MKLTSVFQHRVLQHRVFQHSGVFHGGTSRSASRRGRTAQMFPAEAERLVTQAELQRLLSV
jgi:hypothetical protein